MSHNSSDSNSSLWNSDSEDPAPSPRRALQADVAMETGVGSVDKKKGGSDWLTSPEEGVSPDTSIDDFN